MDFNSVSEIVSGVKTGKNQAKRLLYKLLQKECYPIVKSFIYNKGGNVHDAEDKFQDAMIALFGAIDKDKFNLRNFNNKSHVNQLSAYIVQIVKNLWHKELRWRNRPTLESATPHETAPAFELLPGVVKEVFEELEPDDKHLLSQFFQQKKSYTKIANASGGQMNTEQVKKRMGAIVENMLQEVRTIVPKDLTDQLIQITKESIQELGERCQKLLTYFYMQRKSMEEIADLMDYSSANSAREQKFRCMRHLNMEVAKKLLNQK